jgi:hypothetical protein
MKTRAIHRKSTVSGSFGTGTKLVEKKDAERVATELNANTPPLAARDQQSLIRWTTEREIQEVSKKLARINQVAIRAEVNGDYNKSGDLAYQIQEIIRATAELFKKSQRSK